jgi:uncharacterized phage infection (PIP) family protein YhgE
MQPVLKISIVFLLAALLAACGRSDQTTGTVTASDVKKESREAAETAAEYSRQQYQAFMQQAKSKLDDIDRRIQQLRDKGELLQGQAQEAARAELQKLQQDRGAIREKMQTLEKSGAEAWKDMQAGVKSAMDRLDQAVDRAAREFK